MAPVSGYQGKTGEGQRPPVRVTFAPGGCVVPRGSPVLARPASLTWLVISARDAARNRQCRLSGRSVVPDSRHSGTGPGPVGRSTTSALPASFATTPMPVWRSPQRRDGRRRQTARHSSHQTTAVRLGAAPSRLRCDFVRRRAPDVPTLVNCGSAHEISCGHDCMDCKERLQFMHEVQASYTGITGSRHRR